MPNNWPEVVRYSTEYTPRIGCKVVYWKLPSENTFKCNTDGASKVMRLGLKFLSCQEDGRRGLTHSLGGDTGDQKNTSTDT
ncbi:hypothetical protein H5410_002969 [Solanum commersonii]|uniref:Uncharacterized protein n=1 Tax=Solanum commersonii TaxID=4109 RepID=A0A9J6B3N3_SOLCO|nr:hypothetical protein H5410_002969 [Solanum commersonii]